MHDAEVHGLTLSHTQGLQTIGLSAVQTGMDNVRNMTGSPIAGIDPHELIDVRPLNYGAQHASAIGVPLAVPTLMAYKAAFLRILCCWLG